MAMVKNVIISSCLAFCLTAAAPAWSQANGKDVVQQLVTLFSAWSDAHGRHDIFQEAAQHIDYGTMTEMAFTPAQWDGFSPVQKREMVQAFQKLVENRYYQRWHRLFLRSRLSIANEAKAGGDTYVKTFLTEGKDEDTVIWRLRPRNGEPMVISLNVNGKDLLTRLSDRFQKQLKRRGPAGLVAWMKDEERDGKDDDSSSSSAQHRASASR